MPQRPPLSAAVPWAAAGVLGHAAAGRRAVRGQQARGAGQRSGARCAGPGGRPCGRSPRTRTLRGGARIDAPYDRAVMRDLIDLAPPGLDEVFGLLAIGEALQRHEVVVVDTAPTGHALRLLELVAKAREWLQVLLEILLKYRR